MLRLTGLDLNLYKEKQMKRRIENYIVWHRLGDYETLADVLRQDSNKQKLFLDYITINVTEFFRTPDHWKMLEEEVLAKMTSFNVWSCACSTGEEAYSIVMSLAEHAYIDQIHVLATDIDENVLAIARKGVYDEKTVEKVPTHYLKEYFVPTQGGYKVCDEIRNCIEFRKLNLLADDYPQGMDLILCRNILIYFTQEAKAKIYATFHDSLASGGYLFTGHTEQLINYKEIGFHRITKSIYKK